MQFGFLVFFNILVSNILFSEELKTAAQDSAPKYFKFKNGGMQGLCVDIMKAIERIEPTIKFNGYGKFIPFKRLQLQLEKGELDVFFGFKKTPSRKEKYQFVELPLYQMEYVIAVKKEDNVKIKSLKDILHLGVDGKILTLFSSAASKYLKKEKLFFDEGAKTPTALLNMLMSNRGRFVFYHKLGLHATIKNKELGNKIKVLSVNYLTYNHYVAFSKKVPIKTVEGVASALQKLKQSGKLKQIFKKYSEKK